MNRVAMVTSRCTMPSAMKNAVAVRRREAEQERRGDQQRDEQEVQDDVRLHRYRLDQARGHRGRRGDDQYQDTAMIDTAVAVPESKFSRNGAAIRTIAATYSIAPWTNAGMGP